MRYWQSFCYQTMYHQISLLISPNIRATEQNLKGKRVLTSIILKIFFLAGWVKVKSVWENRIWLLCDKRVWHHSLLHRPCFSVLNTGKRRIMTWCEWSTWSVIASYHLMTDRIKTTLWMWINCVVHQLDT